MPPALPHIYVDNDACPVKDEILRVAERYTLQVTFVSNQGMRPLRLPNVRSIIVDSGFDAADNWIVENITPGDIVITSDIPLAARCLKKSAHAVGHSGHLFTAENIGSAMANRELNSYLREAGEIKGYNPSFSKQDRSRFLQVLDGVVTRGK